MRAALAILLVLLFTLCAGAQETPKFEIFAGYSLFDAEAQQRNAFNGAQFNFKLNLSPSTAFMADVGGQYRSDPNLPPRNDLSFFNFHDRYLHAYQAFVGPEFTWRHDNSDLFVHTLAGLVHGVARAAGENFVGLGLGGGFVFHRQKHFGFRGQADYVPNRGAGRTYHDFRLGAGVVFRKR